MQKKFQKDSKLAKRLDHNDDGEITTEEELRFQERLIRLENNDKKEDQQRHLVWFSALTVTIFIIVLMTPVVPIERIDHLSGIAEIWVLSNMGVLASFIGFNQLAKRGVKDDNKS